MASEIHRRDFLLKASAACMGGCVLYSGKDLIAMPLQDEKRIIPEKLCYCGGGC